ncbi:biotin transporter BioY [Desulforamulus ferrireducens]|uniref:Biotin transporter n=1 Tax=Desulforamulus ferrireducens TaxID=1833852 RepID=A0A1S6IT33_9FIRM|nr:biotin transporter BioY [Desulforamulus ferrireducens]AQS57922.1 biotin transporter BioY [Desulforamulus ferrireducens]
MKLSTREITLAGLMAALIIVVVVITRIPFVSAVVPFSLQPLLALLAGAVLGPKVGALSMVIYILLGLMGLPVFSAEPFGGLAYVLKPSFGFLLGQLLAAYLTGKILQGKDPRQITSYLLAALAGMVAIYGLGLPYLYVILNFYLGKAISVGGVIGTFFLPFALWDLFKVVIAASLARAIHLRLPKTMLNR